MLLQKVIKRAVVKKRVKQKNLRRSIKPSHDFWYKIQHNEFNKRNDSKG
jgi:hypothetical protein